MKDNEKKKQTTIYITKEDEKIIKDLKAIRLLTGKESSSSRIFCDAIKEIHKRDFYARRKEQDGRVSHGNNNENTPK